MLRTLHIRAGSCFCFSGNQQLLFGGIVQMRACQLFQMRKPHFLTGTPVDVSRNVHE